MKKNKKPGRQEKRRGCDFNRSRPNLGNIERGRTKLTDRVLADMSRVFQINPDWIVYGDGPMFLSAQDPLTFEILRLYSELTPENKNYLYGYI